MPSIDFAEVRRRVPITRVFELVGFQPARRSGAELRGACPIHRGRSPRSRSFAANLEKNVFRCFHCGAAGNVLDLWAAVHQIDIYRAAVELCEQLGIELPETTTCKNK
jgi:DNA primase